MGLEIFTLRERPDLRPLIFASDLQSVWPEFMTHSAAAELYFAPWMFDRYLDYAFAGVADGKVVARAFSVPFAFNTGGRTELPDGGWDQVIRWAHDDRMIGRAPNALSALEISMLPEARGSGNSLALLGAMKACAKDLEQCSRRCDRTKSIYSHARRCATTSTRCVPMVFRSTPG
jgi:GNAT superfamily N-acetyltransferase